MEPVARLPNVAAPEEGAPKRLRALELGLVLLVVFSQLVAISVYAVFTGANLYGSSPGHAFTLVGILMELGGLALLRYVLFRQGRSFAGLGLGFSWNDIPKSVLVIILAYVAFIIWWIAISQTYRLMGRALNSAPHNIDFLASMLSVWGILFLVLNPFFEELIARAYVISEIKFLTGSSTLAVLCSVVLQSSYHLYQGLVPALLTTSLFTVFSLYYVKTKRIMPVILAHMFFDFLVFFRGYTHG
jgi:membrane protease YdiL (CAAX protease family)